MNFKLYIIGKIKNKDHKDALKEYQKRLSRYCKIKTIEAKDLESIIKQLSASTHIVQVSPSPDSITSEAFSEKINQWGVTGKSDVSFIYTEESIHEDECLSFSNLNLTIDMLSIILHEQIYRGYRIMRNEPYHK